MGTFSGSEVRRRRQSQGLRAEHLAVVADRSAAAIHAYEVGQIDPPASVVAALAAALGCDPGDLYTGGVVA